MDLKYEGNVLTTLRDDGSRIWMRPKLSLGRFLSRRQWVGYALIVLFLVLPFVRVGGYPAILLDVMARRFHFFGVTFHPTDSVLLMFLMLSIFLGIFWITALFGRVWCGWGCPQTVYMELLFRPIERLIEGNTGQQRKLDEKRFTVRRTLKWAVFMVIAFVLGNQFLAYFVGWERLAVWMTESPTEHLGGFGVMAVTTGLVFFDFAYFREQMCTVVCPYARLQSALLDRHSLIVGYDKLRGEARRRVKERTANDDSGDCIDCHACVVTCPTGIDIRNGLQLECISCTQCIDACDNIMDKVGKPRGLIRLSSQHHLETKKPTRLVRPRVVLYPLIILVFMGLLVYLVTTKAAADVTILRQHGAPYVVLGEDMVQNPLRVKLVNRTDGPRVYSLAIPELGREPDTQAARKGAGGMAAPTNAGELLAPQFPLKVAKGDTVTSPFLVTVPRSRFEDGRFNVSMIITDDHGFKSEHQFWLLGPK